MTLSKYRAAALFAFGLLTAMALPAAAQEINLVGTWKGTASAVHIGATPYRAAEGAGVNFSEGIEYTYVISQQKGNRFAGELSGGKIKETIIGAVLPDNRGGIILDDDGHNNFVMIDSNTMDVCYHHQKAASKVVACLRLTRSR